MKGRDDDCDFGNDLLSQGTIECETGKIIEALLVLHENEPCYQKNHIAKFIEKLHSLPSSGGGGLHQALLGIANHAVRFDMAEETFVSVLATHITGTRVVSESEIQEAYRRAANDYQGNDGNHPVQPGVSSSPVRHKLRSSRTLHSGRSSQGIIFEHNRELVQERDEIIRSGQGISSSDLMKASKIPISTDPVEQACLLLKGLYQGTGSLLFAGSRIQPGILGRSLRGDVRLQQHFTQCGVVDFEHLIPNPLDGKRQPTKSGTGTTMRGDNNVLRFLFAVAEFDNLPLEDQRAFWAKVNLPIAALTYSGGKSIHALIKIEGVTTLEQWDVQVKQKLYAEYLVPMGIDKACCNCSRLTRMPGHFREDKGAIQQLLYLNPKAQGGPIV